MIDAARPAVLKAADFPRVSPDDLVVAVAKKRRIKVDEVNALHFHCFEDFEIVAEDETVYRHEAILFLPLAAAALAAASHLPADCVRFFEPFRSFHHCALLAAAAVL
jgi:hypothetical protein